MIRKYAKPTSLKYKAWKIQQNRKKRVAANVETAPLTFGEEALTFGEEPLTFGD